MIPWVHLDTARVPGGGELRLMQRGDEFSIMSGQLTLMNSRLRGSEEALATMTHDRVGGRARPRILIGGLGMGFTLRAALATFPADAGIVVAELVPEVVAWARGPMAAMTAGSLDDPRVEIFVGDVAAAIGSAPGAWDAILLDVDNGPEGLTRRANDGLYTPAGLAAAHRALRPGGVLAVWSFGPEAEFTRRLQRTAFAIEEVRVRAHRAGRGARHVIWFATRAAKPRQARDTG